MVMMNSILNETMFNEVASFIYCVALYTGNTFDECIQSMDERNFDLETLSVFAINRNSLFTIKL